MTADHQAHRGSGWEAMQRTLAADVVVAEALLYASGGRRLTVEHGQLLTHELGRQEQAPASIVSGASFHLSRDFEKNVAQLAQGTACPRVVRRQSAGGCARHLGDSRRPSSGARSWSSTALPEADPAAAPPPADKPCMPCPVTPQADGPIKTGAETSPTSPLTTVAVVVTDTRSEEGPPVPCEGTTPRPSTSPGRVRGRAC